MVQLKITQFKLPIFHFFCNSEKKVSQNNFEVKYILRLFKKSKGLEG